MRQDKISMCVSSLCEFEHLVYHKNFETRLKIEKVLLQNNGDILDAQVLLLNSTVVIQSD